MGPILIVDDSSADRFLIKKALLTQQSDLKLIELETGHDVVNVIKKNNPVATLLDVLRRTFRYKDCPRIWRKYFSYQTRVIR